MTNPEVFRASQRAIESGHSHGANSFEMYEAAQEAIEKTKKLLDNLANYKSATKEKPE
ncbi:MAG: hypothetical protein AB8B47_01445 [Roseobacter sp.]